MDCDGLLGGFTYNRGVSVTITQPDHEVGGLMYFVDSEVSS